MADRLGTFPKPLIEKVVTNYTVRKMTMADIVLDLMKDEFKDLTFAMGKYRVSQILKSQNVEVDPQPNKKS